MNISNLFMVKILVHIYLKCIESQQIIDQKAPGITGQGHIVVHI